MRGRNYLNSLSTLLLAPVFLLSGCSKPELKLPRTIEGVNNTYRVTNDAAFIIESYVNYALWASIKKRFRKNIQYVDTNGNLEIEHIEAYDFMYNILIPAIDGVFDKVKDTRQAYLAKNDKINLVKPPSIAELTATK